jgi:hypothetical protein
MKNVVKIIIITATIIAGIALINRHQDLERESYAEMNSCEWVVSGGFDICK